MKHLIALLISIALIIVAVGAAVQNHQSYLDQQAVHNAALAVQQARQAVQEKAQAAAEAAKAQDQINHLEASCQNGLDAYNLLTVSQRKQVVKPDCGL